MGAPVFLLGVRENPSEPFRYLRVPADDQGSMDGFHAHARCAGDPAAATRPCAAMWRRPSSLAARTGRAAAAVCLRALALFAGCDGLLDGKPAGGLQAISDFMEANVPEAERARAGEVLVRILNGTLFELAQLTRERAGLKPLEQDDQTRPS
jgi:cytochrome c biogenesis protein